MMERSLFYTIIEAGKAKGSHLNHSSAWEEEVNTQIPQKTPLNSPKTLSEPVNQAESDPCFS